MGHIKQFSDWQEIRESLQTNESANKHILRQYFKNKAKEKSQKQAEELEAITLTDGEIVEILTAVKSKKYDVMGNMDKLKKLQKMGLVKYPDAVQKASSFSFPFYLTTKGEKRLK